MPRATISGASIARKTSFLLESEGAQLFDSGLSVVDDPLRLRGLGSRGFDGEGLPTARRAIIDKGVLTGWLMESAAARQLGRKPTGHASRGGSGAPGTTSSNLHLEGGTLSVAELIADIDYGVYVHELSGQGVNSVTGDYSRGASGFWVENGRIAYPVHEITIAGNMKDMLKGIEAVGADAYNYGAKTVGSVLLNRMKVAGS